MTEEPDKNLDPASGSAESSDDTAEESAEVQEDPGTRVSSEDAADRSADAASAEAEEEPAEAEQEAPAAEAEAEEPVAEPEAAEPVAEAEPEAAVDDDDGDDDDELPTTDDETVPVEDDDESPVAEPDGEIGEEEAEEAAAGETTGPETPARTRPSRSRRRAERDPDLPPPVVRAQARYVRSSARKARLVCDQFRGRSVEDARAILAVTPRAIARDWSKLLESAVANAEHNHELVGEDLYVKAVQADEGPTIKRFQPRAKGRATRIRKRTSHLTISLTPKD
jgi:ribosomal protein L22